MADMTLKLTIPVHITAKAQAQVEGGTYFGTEWQFTTVGETGRRAMFAAVSDMLRDYSPEQIAEIIGEFRANVADVAALGGDMTDRA